jgi:glycosyltransferase involved in cell wall biosynthesis
MANQTRQLARLLASEGIQVDLVQVNPPYRPAIIERVHGIRAGFRLVPYMTRLWGATRRVDVVHVMANSGWAWHLFAAPAIWIASMRGVPVIVNYRGGEAHQFFAQQFKWVRPTLAKVQLVVVPSEFLRGVFLKHGVETDIVPNIVDLALFSPAPSPPQSPHLVVTRNLEPIYDIGTAVRAFALVRADYPASRMTVAGSGPCRPELEALARELDLRDSIRFIGRVENAALPALYRVATVALNPSLADNMPISVLEAMASGVPVVSTNVGGVPYLVKDGHTALLVPPKDPIAMAGATARLLSDNALRARLTANAMLDIERYSWQHVRKSLLAAYASAQEMMKASVR